MDDESTLTSLRGQANEDNDPDDETQDFRFLAALSKTGGQLPKRGEKDFEPHGTKHQEGVLESSRHAMHDALSHTRVHVPRNHTRGYYYGRESIERDEVIAEDWRQGLDDDHVVLLESSRGPHFRSMGKQPYGKKNPDLWLLPEEALYLVERGNLDLWWPSRNSYKGNGALNQVNSEEDEGIPMSLQAAYALLIGDDSEKGKISLDRYTVYANLKRMGYVALRAPDWDPTKPAQALSQEPGIESESLFTWLFGKIFASKEVEHPAYGPLVKPGMYRSYNSIYQQIAVIPRHKPTPIPTSPAPPSEDPYRVVFLLWQADNTLTFAKSNPGLPNFRLAIADARSSSIPSLMQMSSLLESTKWDPPNDDLNGPAKMYQRLKHGWRNVVLAVIDQGVVSYLRLAEVAFGQEEIYDRFDRGSVQGPKRGGFRGNRGGRGRGRGRGRGSN